MHTTVYQKTIRALALTTLLMLAGSFVVYGIYTRYYDIGITKRIDSEWESYHNKSIGMIVKVPQDAEIKTQDEWLSEFYRTSNVAWFSKGPIESVSSRIMSGEDFGYKGFDPEVRQERLDYKKAQMQKTQEEHLSLEGSSEDRLISYQYEISGHNVFFDRPWRDDLRGGRFHAVAIGKEYIHVARLNLNYINSIYPETKNMSFEEQTQKYIEIAKEYILDVDPF